MKIVRLAPLLFLLYSCSQPTRQELVAQAVKEIKRHCTVLAGKTANVEIFASMNSILYRCNEDYSQGRIDVDTLPIILVP
jgi:hypothetical protein